MKQRSLILVLAALGAFSACEEDPPYVVDGNGGGGSGAGAGGSEGGMAPCDEAMRCGLDGCCTAEEECVNGYQCLPPCENERCGDNLEVCCDAGLVCLAGALCAADCPSNEPLCGANLDTCCAAGDVCLNDACVTPGATCSDIFDCPDGEYCEETIGQCLPLPAGALCEGEPTFNDVDPTLEWYWSGVDYLGTTYPNIAAAPAIGDVNGDGTPDIVVVLYNDSDTLSLLAVLDGAGDGLGGGDLLFTIPSAANPSAASPWPVSSVALGNFDGDVGLEIVYQPTTGGVVIADNDGIGNLGVRTTGSASQLNFGGPSLADLNHDGVPEVIMRCHAMDGTDISDPGLDLMDLAGCGENTVVADLDLDGLDEVIDASHARTAIPGNGSGLAFWAGNNGLTSGFVAVADILSQQLGPEVISVAEGELHIVHGQTGAILVGSGGSLYTSAVTIPGGGTGGAPTVADFDGDGLPEIGAAGLASYVVFDPDCASPPLRQNGQCASATTDLVLWSMVTQDTSSITGSSVFDFQGDGIAEVLYNDECFLHVYDGRDGTELLSPVLASSSRTAAEYPLVADVDADGNAEIVVIGNRDKAENRDDCDTAWKAAGVPIDSLCQQSPCTAGPACSAGTCADIPDGSDIDSYQCDVNDVCQLAGGTQGVHVYGDAFDRWVRTRPVWNQFGYHVTNMEVSGGFWDVPTTEPASWLTANNYRQNVQGGVLFPVPDLRVELTATPQCPGNIALVATIHNDGSAGAPPGLQVDFLRTDAGTELLGTIYTTEPILPGGFQFISLDHPDPPADTSLEYTVSLDPEATVEECNDDNNTATDTTLCEGIE